MPDGTPLSSVLGPVVAIVNEGKNGHGFQAYIQPNANGFATELFISGPRVEELHICSYLPVLAPETGERLATLWVVEQADVTPEMALTHLMTRWGETELVR